jgi:hypothetical protein
MAVNVKSKSEEDCMAWKRDPFRNPKTGKAINPNSRTGIYAQYNAACNDVAAGPPRAPRKKDSDSKISKKDCEVWVTNPRINPKTGRKIDPNSKTGAFVQYKKACASLLMNKPSEKKAASPAHLEKVTIQKEGRRKESKKEAEADARVKEIQDKYCRCLMHVRPKKGNPYGICTKSVLHKYEVKRPPMCKYDYTAFTDEELKGYAQEKKIPLKSKSRSSIAKQIAAWMAKTYPPKQ